MFLNPGTYFQKGQEHPWRPVFHPWHALRTVDEAMYLGVTIQSNLNWKHHIKNIWKKGKQHSWLPKKKPEENSEEHQRTNLQNLRPPNLRVFILLIASLHPRSMVPSWNDTETSCKLCCVWQGRNQVGSQRWARLENFHYNIIDLYNWKK